MQIKFNSLQGDDSNRSGKNSESPIFDSNFQVEAMDNPMKFLPSYQPKYSQDETSCVEDCSICCGNICTLCAYPFSLCCCRCCCIYELPTATVGVVEEFGKFKRLLKPGFNMINICSEEVGTVDLRIKLLPTGQHPTITKDNVNVSVKASIAYRITNPILSYYVIREQLNRALTQLTVASLRNVIGSEILDDVLTERKRIAGLTRNQIQKGMPAGIYVDRVFMEQIIIPPDIQKDLTSAARQRRISEANIINSKADVESAALMKESAELLDTKAAMQIRYLEMVSELGKEGVILMMQIGVHKKGYKN